MNICHSDWFNKEADLSIVGQNKVRERPKQRMLVRRVKSGITNRHRKKQDGQVVLRKGTKPRGKVQIKNMG